MAPFAIVALAGLYLAFRVADALLFIVWFIDKLSHKDQDPSARNVRGPGV